MTSSYFRLHFGTIALRGVGGRGADCERLGARLGDAWSSAVAAADTAAAARHAQGPLMCFEENWRLEELRCDARATLNATLARRCGPGEERCLPTRRSLSRMFRREASSPGESVLRESMQTRNQADPVASSEHARRGWGLRFRFRV